MIDLEYMRVTLKDTFVDVNDTLLMLMIHFYLCVYDLKRKNILNIYLVLFSYM